jgi:dipeptidyl aminopeptidase/acylaminoacyl peptidase
MEAAVPSGSARVFLPESASFGPPAFSPDGRYLTVAQKLEGDAHTEVYGYPLAGGAAVRLTKTENGVGLHSWSPDGSKIAFTATAPVPPNRAAARAAGFNAEIYEEDNRATEMWIWDVVANQSRKLSGEGAVFALEWHPSGEFLAVAWAKSGLIDDHYMNQTIHWVDAATGVRKPLVNNPGKLSEFAWSPDGEKMAYIAAVDRRDPHAGMLYVMDRNSGETQSVPGEDFKGKFESVAWRGGELTGILSLGVHTHRFSFENGEFLIHAYPGVAMTHIAPVPSTALFMVAASTARHPSELFLLDGEKLIRLTVSNPWLADVKFGKQTVEKIVARDGLEIEGVLMWPVDAVVGKKAPLVIVAHGGPESHFSDGWLTSYGNWGQALAARGTMVWFPNYRASTGYGVAFAKADHGDPMGAEFHDHLDAIDAFAKRGLIDRERVGIGGGSYGGYTAAWAATRHSEYFKAAVSFVPFVDIRTKWLCSDIPMEFFHVHYEEKLPQDQAEFLAERSPLTYAAQCKTPLLLLGGTSDTRVHPSQPHMLYRAVKMSTDTPVRYVRYPGEGHGNRINTLRYDYLVRSLQWFDHYLSPEATRMTPMPPIDLDLKEWESSKKK